MYRKKRKALHSKRIAFLAANIHSGSSSELWRPLVDEAERLGIELFLFPGGRLHDNDSEEKIRNHIYEYAADNADAVLSWASSIGPWLRPEELDAFHEPFCKKPLVTLSHRVNGCPMVGIDAYSGMFPLLEHLHKDHGIHHFAYIRGPEDHESGADRYRAFVDYHEQEALPLNMKLVSSHYSWNEGAAGLLELLDQRGLVPGRDFDALLAASDLQLYDALKLLNSRGYRIPDDLLLAGFNDTIESRIASPPFTTVQLPFGDQALLAFRDLCALMTGDAVGEKRMLDTRLIIRRSCGCMSASVQAAGSVASACKPDTNLHAEQLYTRLLEESSRVLGSGSEERSAWLEPLIRSFLDALKESGETTETAFLKLLERILQRQIELRRDPVQWQAVFSAIRQHCALLGRRSEYIAAENLVDKARVLIAEASTQLHQAEQWGFERRTHIIQELEKDLIQLQDRNALNSLLESRLPELGISAAYVMELRQNAEAFCIAYFDASAADAGEHSSVSLPYACDEGELVPGAVFGSHPGACWVVEPLCGNGLFFGWLLLRLGIQDGTVYEEIRSALSSALLGLRGIDIIRKARRDAEKAEKLKTRFMAHVSADFLDPLYTIKKAANELKNSGKKSAGELSNTEHIIALADKQIRITHDVMELSRSEIGAWDMNLVLLYPDKLVHSCVERINKASGTADSLYFEQTTIFPLLAADEQRLLYLFETALHHACRCTLSWNYMQGACALMLDIHYKQDRADDTSFSVSRQLATRIAAAHGGILELETHEPDHELWILKLPLPHLNRSDSSFAEREKSIFCIHGKTVLDAAESGLGAFMEGVKSADIASLLSSPEKMDTAAAFCWAASTGNEQLRSLIRALGRHPAARDKPCLVFFEDLPEMCNINSISALLQQGSNKAGTLILYDPDPETCQDLLRAFSVLPDVIPKSIQSIDDFEAEFFCSDTVYMAVLSNVAQDKIHDIRQLAKNGERPLMLLLQDYIKGDSKIETLLSDRRILMLNNGILDKRELVELCGRLLLNRASDSPYTGTVVKTALLYLNEHYSLPLVRWKIAEAAHVSEDYLSRVFRKELGLSPWDYLTRLRIRESKRLLLESTDSIAAIASATGFSDQAYFCRVFKKAEGLAPLVFRKAAIVQK